MSEYMGTPAERLLAGTPSRIAYIPVQPEETVGKTIEAVKGETVSGAYGPEDAIRFLFADGTTCAFVLPPNEIQYRS